jgi:hypothetical protein
MYCTPLKEDVLDLTHYGSLYPKVSVDDPGWIVLGVGQVAIADIHSSVAFLHGQYTVVPEVLYP